MILRWIGEGLWTEPFPCRRPVTTPYPRAQYAAISLLRSSVFGWVSQWRFIHFLPSRDLLQDDEWWTFTENAPRPVINTFLGAITLPAHNFRSFYLPDLKVSPSWQVWCKNHDVNVSLAGILLSAFVTSIHFNIIFFYRNAVDMK